MKSKRDKRLSGEKLKDRIKLVEKIMRLEGSHFDFNTGEVKVVNRLYPNKARKSNMNKDGYAYFLLRDSEQKKYGIAYVHQIIMIMADSEQYYKEMSNKKTINHINGDKTDNRLCNLEYLSTRDNLTHAYVNGLKKSKNKKLSPHEAYKALKSYYVQGVKKEVLIKELGISLAAFKKLIKGKSYQSIYKVFKRDYGQYIERKKVGEGSRVLTSTDVVAILQDYYTHKVTQAHIAKMYRISRSTVGMIVTGKRWTAEYNEFFDRA